MANVQYTVFYRYLHPISNKPVTNKNTNYKVFAVDKTSTSATLVTSNDVTFTAADVPAGETLDQYTIDRGFPTSKEFDMLFVYSGLGAVGSFSTGGGYGSAATPHTVNADVFQQVKGDPWFVASVTGSLESAMSTVTRLVKKIGINNVKLVKNVPIELELGIE